MRGVNRAIYPGTFDPVTNGHLDVLERGLNIFDEIIVLLAKNINKEPMFSVEERIEMIRSSTNDPRVKIEILEEGLVVNYASIKKAVAIIRGLRQVSDFEYEYQIALMNRHLHPEITTVFLLPNEKYTYLASSIIREVAKHGGDIQDFVPPIVEDTFRKKFQKKNLLKLKGSIKKKIK